MNTTIECFTCFQIISLIDIEEQSIIQCTHCNLKFTFIYCTSTYNKHRIFFKIPSKASYYIQDNQEKVDFYTGINIKCPYNNNDCTEFYLTRCPECKYKTKLKTKIKETNSITCIKCNYVYYHLNPPVLDTKEIITYKVYTKSQEINFPHGIKFKVINKDYVVQKINCVSCLRSIVFQKGSYYEGQLVKCPYNDCNIEFNRTICPYCFNENNFCRLKEHNGNYKKTRNTWIDETNEDEYRGYCYLMGSNIKCNQCKKIYVKVFCYACKNFFKINKNLEGLNIECKYQKCLKSFKFINCIFCFRMNVFPIENTDSGINNNKIDTRKGIQCGYPDCGKFFHKISCYHCKRLNVYPNETFVYGKKYICQFFSCRKDFVVYFCKKCNRCLTANGNMEGWKNICGHCHSQIVNWKCCFCNKTIIENNSTLKCAQMVRCPNQKCKKVYSFILCIGCNNMIYSKENECLEGKIINCFKCGKQFSLIRCNYCKSKTYSLNQLKININTKKKCKACGWDFIPNNTIGNNSIYEKSTMCILNPIKGTDIPVGIPEVDMNEIYIQNSIISNQQMNNVSMIYSDSSDDSCERKEINYKEKMCIICKSRPREAVFVPCGHRCSCYNCAVMQFQTYKMCLCGKFARCVINKIFD